MAPTTFEEALGVRRTKRKPKKKRGAPRKKKTTKKRAKKTSKKRAK
jgi:hypothetical protein